MTQEFKPTVVYGGVSGYINTEVEVKYANNANKTPYVSMLLGRGKDRQGNPLPTLQLVAYDQTARLLAAECSKGDLVRFTEIMLQPVKDDTFKEKNIAQSFKLVVNDFEKIQRNSNNTTNQPTRNQQPAPQPQQSAQPQPAQQPADDSFDDDIPF